jgi:tetratricopeptide (TPR) repeat protein
MDQESIIKNPIPLIKKIQPIEITNEIDLLTEKLSHKELKFSINQLAKIYHRLSDLNIGIKNFKNAERYLKKFIEIYPENIESNIALMHLFLANSKKNKSIKAAQDLLNSYPNNIEVLNNCAYIKTLCGLYSASINISKKTLDIDSKNINALSNIESCYASLGNYDECIKYCYKSLNLDNNNIDTISRLSTSLLYKEDFKLSLNYLKKLEKLDPLNSTVSSLYPYLQHQLKLKSHSRLISNPLGYISKFKISSELDQNSNFSSDIINYLNGLKKEWSPNRRSTENGFVTENFYFDEEVYPMLDLKNILNNYIDKYFKNYAHSNDFFITRRPQNHSLYGWGVFLKEQGMQKSHNHNSGWLSGVLYLDIPKELKAKEGYIEFSLSGYNFPYIDNNIPKKTMKVSNNMLLLFPSSLYHKTIPFSSASDRVSLAFDLIRK